MPPHVFLRFRKRGLSTPLPPRHSLVSTPPSTSVTLDCARAALNYARLLLLGSQNKFRRAFAWPLVCPREALRCYHGAIYVRAQLIQLKRSRFLVHCAHAESPAARLTFFVALQDSHIDARARARPPKQFGQNGGEAPTTANKKKFPLNSRRTAAGLPTELPANL